VDLPLTAVDADLQAETVYLIRETRNSVRKCGVIVHQPTRRAVSGVLNRPAVVDCARLIKGQEQWAVDILLFTYSYPRSFSPKLTISLAAVMILSASTSHPKAFQLFQPSAGNRP
jgi:hypothetical protein